MDIVHDSFGHVIGSQGHRFSPRLRQPLSSTSNSSAPPCLIAGGDHDSRLALDQHRHHIRFATVEHRHALRTSGNVLVNRTWLQGHGATVISGATLRSSAICVWYVPSDLIACPCAGLDVSFVSHLWLQIRSIGRPRGASPSPSGLPNLLQIS